MTEIELGELRRGGEEGEIAKSRIVRLEGHELCHFRLTHIYSHTNTFNEKRYISICFCKFEIRDEGKGRGRGRTSGEVRVVTDIDILKSGDLENLLGQPGEIVVEEVELQQHDDQHIKERQQTPSANHQREQEQWLEEMSTVWSFGRSPSLAEIVSRRLLDTSR